MVLEDNGQGHRHQGGRKSLWHRFRCRRQDRAATQRLRWPELNNCLRTHRVTRVTIVTTRSRRRRMDREKVRERQTKILHRPVSEDHDLWLFQFFLNSSLYNSWYDNCVCMSTHYITLNTPMLFGLPNFCACDVVSHWPFATVSRDEPRKKFGCEVSSFCTRVRKFQLDVFSASGVRSSNASTIYFVVARTGIREFLATSKSVVSWSECEWMRKYS